MLPGDKESLADYYAEELRSVITEHGPADRFLVAAPPVPRSFKGWDGKAGFDGAVVTLTWCLWLKVRGQRMPLQPDKDPASVIFSLGWGATHMSLPFAAAVPATIPSAEPPKPVRGSEVAELITKLGELRDAGVLSEEEFQAKKAELLSRL